MSQLWKSFRTNMMYWRFRYITRNRLRFQSWLARRRQPQQQRGFRPRASAVSVAYSSRRVTWIAIGVMAVLLALLRTYGDRFISPSLIWPLGTLIVVLAIYWALRGR